MCCITFELSGAERSEGRQKRKLLAVRLNELSGTQANRKHAAAEAKLTSGAKAETNQNCAAPKLNCKPHGHRNALHQITARPENHRKTRGPVLARAKWLKPGSTDHETEPMVLLKYRLNQAYVGADPPAVAGRLERRVRPQYQSRRGHMPPPQQQEDRKRLCA